MNLATHRYSKRTYQVMKEEQKHQASQFAELRGSVDTEPADRDFDSLNDMSKFKVMPSQ